MRAGFNSLAAKVQTVLERDPFSGHVFVFRGKRGDGPSPSGGACRVCSRRFDQPNRKSSSSAQRRQTAASIGVLVEGSCGHTSPSKHRYDSDLYKDRSSKP
ncbi:MAG: Mobile element protein [uncultured Paraburkholderia sp.]|nr:MAG: Mobile element protein [uncultured Paraburkholderia sp.]